MMGPFQMAAAMRGVLSPVAWVEFLIFEWRALQGVTPTPYGYTMDKTAKVALQQLNQAAQAIAGEVEKAQPAALGLLTPGNVPFALMVAYALLYKRVLARAVRLDPDAARLLDEILTGRQPGSRWDFQEGK